MDVAEALDNDNIEHQWTQEWPTEEGLYWFYGQRYGEDDCELCFIRSWQTKNLSALVCEGNFLYKSETGPVAWFQPIDPPKPPESLNDLSTM